MVVVRHRELILAALFTIGQLDESDRGGTFGQQRQNEAHGLDS